MPCIIEGLDKSTMGLDKHSWRVTHRGQAVLMGKGSDKSWRKQEGYQGTQPGKPCYTEH